MNKYLPWFNFKNAKDTIDRHPPGWHNVTEDEKLREEPECQLQVGTASMLTQIYAVITSLFVSLRGKHINVPETSPFALRNTGELTVIPKYIPNILFRSKGLITSQTLFENPNLARLFSQEFSRTKLSFVV